MSRILGGNPCDALTQGNNPFGLSETGDWRLTAPASRSRRWHATGAPGLRGTGPGGSQWGTLARPTDRPANRAAPPAKPGSKET
jgi:hypothetical protein